LTSTKFRSEHPKPLTALGVRKETILSYKKGTATPR
jgi:hypothetical protein